MNPPATEWEPCTIRVETLTEGGVQLIVDGVPGRKNKTTGAVLYKPEDALRIHYEATAKKAGLHEVRQFAILAMLGSPAYSLKATHVPYHYHLNKMLFYQWKRLENQGLGEAFPHDKFVAERKGPVPEHIEADLDALEKEGLIEERKWPTGKKHEPVPVVLSAKGQGIAKALFEQSEPWVQDATSSVKTDLILLSPTDLKTKVHADYPEYKRDFVEVDAA